MDDLLLTAGDPDALLVPLFALIESQPLEKERLVELSTLVTVLDRWYYCPSVSMLMIRALNAVLDKDPAILDEEPFTPSTFETILFLGFGLDDIDATSLVLDWCLLVASHQPTSILQHGFLYLFLHEHHHAHVSLRRRLTKLAHELLHVDTQRNIAELLSCADSIAEMTLDSDGQVARKALQWTYYMMQHAIPLQPTYAILWVHHTSVLTHWFTLFSTTKDMNIQAALLNFVSQLVQHGVDSEWVEKSFDLCFTSTSSYPLKQASVRFLAAISKVGCMQHDKTSVEQLSSSWICQTCTFENPSDVGLSNCLVCDAFRDEMPRLDRLKSTWRERRAQLKPSDSTLPSTVFHTVDLSRFGPHVYKFLRYEALQDDVISSLPLFQKLVDPSNPKHLFHFADILGILATESEDIDVLSHVKDFAPHDTTLWNQLLAKHGVHSTATNTSDWKQFLEIENDVVKISEYASVNPPTWFETKKTLKYVARSPAPLLALRRDALDFLFFKEQAPSFRAWNELRNCRIHVNPTQCVDTLVHPLLCLKSLVNAVQEAADNFKSSEDKFSSTMKFETLVVKANEHPIISTFDCWTKARQKMLSSDSLCNTFDEYTDSSIMELFLYPQDMPMETTLPLPAVKHIKEPLPRLSWCVERLCQIEWRRLSKQLPSEFSSFLRAQPTLVPLNIRTKFYMGDTSTREMREVAGGRHTAQVYRTSLISSSESVLKWPSSNVLYVMFEGEKGHGVGPTAEFYSDLSREFGHCQWGLWHIVNRNDDKYVSSPSGWFPAVDATTEKHLRIFDMFGRFLARSSLDGYSINIHVSLAFLKALQGQELTWRDIESVDPNFFGSLTRLNKYSHEDLDAMELYFTMPGYGSLELCEQGSERKVNGDNLAEYVSLIQAKWEKSVQAQVEAVLQGYSQLANPAALQFFIPEELQELWEPDDSKLWTYEEIVANIECSGGYSWATSSIMSRLGDLLLTMNRTERRCFLQFVTGTPCLPVDGLGQVKMSIVRVPYTGALPTSNTCQRCLKLPEYESAEELQVKLLLAIAEGQAYFALD
ncbi:hypothetical protein AeRB84_015184 [Aphanomyces euteiches]|nr:hypothetical protein AeRB84_015184 [Aphanomyces euteiches]